MSTLVKHISCLIFALLSFTAFAQDLPKLPQASQITTGTLPNGVFYYIVNNPSEKGFADFALIKKGSSNVGQERKSLSSLPHFTSRSPYEFLASHGIGCHSGGYVSHVSGSAVYDFRGVPVYSRSVTDSTLLMLFDIMAGCPTEQAMVLSGDIKASDLKERLETMSLFVNRLSPAGPANEYVWTPSDSISCHITTNSTSDLAILEVQYAMPRIPRERIATVQPLVTAQFNKELGLILEKRLRTAFRMSGIPLACVRSRYRDSSDSDSHEMFSLEVFTSCSLVHEAASLLSSVLATLDRDGASLDEYSDAKAQVVSEAERDAGNLLMSNSEYVDRCVANYLYGASLASPASVNEFFARRNMPGEKELKLFNGYASALIDPEANLSLNCSLAVIPDEEDLVGQFRKSWAKEETRGIAHRVAYSDTLGLFTPPLKPAVKIRKEASEPISGGTMWTLSNGIRVIYKKTQMKGEFDYALMIRGGVSEVEGLKKGESAFVGDMLQRSRVAGMSSYDFHNMLECNGIAMESEVSLSDLRIRGNAPTSKFTLLLSSLLSMALDREADTESFSYYKACERLRAEMSALSLEGIEAVMDSLVCQGLYYPEHKSVDCLEDDLPIRAEAYFKRQFSKVGDGVIVFAGDLPVDEVKRQICLYFGAFESSKKTSARPKVSCPMSSGCSTYTSSASECPVGDGIPGVNVEICAPVPFSKENNIAFQLACDALERHLVKELTESGQYVRMTARSEIYPMERVCVFLNFRTCAQDGLPEGIPALEPLSALPAIREALSGLKVIDIPAAVLKADKDRLCDDFSARMGRPDSILDAVLLRYSEGKDIYTDFKSQASSVSPDAVKAILARLESGTKVEYIIL